VNFFLSSRYYYHRKWSIGSQYGQRKLSIVEYFALREISRMNLHVRPVEDDRHLVAQIAHGEKHALEELYARYQRPIFTYLLQLTADYGLAEEILQDTLVAVWKGARSFEGRASVLTWLIGIARRQAHNALRQHKIIPTDEAELVSLPATDPEPEAFALASVARDELTAAFKQLPILHREVLMLVLVQEFSYEEAARVLAIPVGTVKSRLSHAKLALRTILTAREEAEK
jgi:RNA polymerase sigma factor (sigma-70 family)